MQNFLELTRVQVDDQIDALLDTSKLDSVLISALRQVVEDLREGNAHPTQYEYLLIILLGKATSEQPISIRELIPVIKTGTSKNKNDQGAMEQRVRNLIGRLNDKIQEKDSESGIFFVPAYTLGRRKN